MRIGTAMLALVVGLGAARQARAQAPSPQLAQMIAQVAQSLAPGQRPVSQPFGTFGAHRAPVSFAVQLQGGACYNFIGTGGPGVVDTDMFLFEPMGRRVALDRRYDAWMHIVYCAAYAGLYRVELKVKRGAGEVGFQVFQAPQGAVAPEMPPPEAVEAPPPNPQVVAAPPPVYTPPPSYPPPDFLGQQVASLAPQLAPGMRPWGAGLTGMIVEGRATSDQYVTLEGGRCYGFVSVAAPTVRRLSTYLWAPTNQRVKDDRSDTGTSHFTVCTTMPGPYHFQAKAGRGEGQFRTGIYVQ